MRSRSVEWFSGIVAITIIGISIISARHFRGLEFSFIDLTGKRVFLEKNSKVELQPTSENPESSDVLLWRVENLFKDENECPRVYFLNDQCGTELTMSIDDLRTLINLRWKIRVVTSEK